MKKFVYQFFIFTIIILLSISFYNYFNDPYGIFRGDFSKPRPTEPNQHFVKIEYLIKNPEKYNAFCFGSSRVGNLDLTKINNNLKYYNMTYSAGLPQEWLDDVKILLNNNVKISQIMLGIDDFSFRVDPLSHHHDYLRIPYQQNNLKTYFTLLLKTPSRPLFLFDQSKSSFFDIYNTGRPLHPNADEEIEKDITKHMKDPKFNIPTFYSGNYITETINSIMQIKKIANDNKIELIVFINPIHRTTYLSNNLDDFNNFKRKLVTVTNYYDFSGLNNITTNNYNYYETSHYRPLVGDMMLDIMFNKPHSTKESFGIYVTPENIDEHITYLESQIN